MRNLLEYPVTTDEAVKALNLARKEWEEKYRGQIGGVDGYALYLMSQFLEQNSEQFDTFSAKCL